MPAKVIQTKAISYTRSGKKMDMVVTRLTNARKLDNAQTDANLESLEFY